MLKKLSAFSAEIKPEGIPDIEENAATDWDEVFKSVGENDEEDERLFDEAPLENWEKKFVDDGESDEGGDEEGDEEGWVDIKSDEDEEADEEGWMTGLWKFFFVVSQVFHSSKRR